MPRVLTLALVGIGIALVVGPLACLNSSDQVGGPDLASGGDLSAIATDLAGLDATMVDLAHDAAKPILDLAASDLTGLFNCYGVAICDPNAEFCIKYYSGSQAVPGQLVSSPACFQPGDTCGNQGQNMDCGCIQNDAALGTNCQGACIDNMDGTFDCYAM